MMGKQHALYGITTGVAVYLVIGQGTIDNALFMVGGSLLGSLLPDIDSPNSLLGSKLPATSGILNNLIDHRTYTHDVALWGIIGILCTWKWPWLLGFFIGYLGHLLLDSMTKGGVPIFYLFNKKPHFLLPYKMRFYSKSETSKRVTLLMCVLTIAIIKGSSYLLLILHGYVSS